MVDDSILIADVNHEGYFSVAVTLDEGPNYIEVVASDPEGNTEYTSFPVIGIP
jgi:hypothetical protein